MDDEYDPPRQRKKPKVKESIIDHTYRDYSQVEVSSDEETTGGGVDDKKQSRLQPNFPAKLHSIVSNPNYQHIICWQPHGRSWKIVDKHLLSTVICPKHFAHAKFESFNRSVNGWGFKRLLNPGPDCKSYYHECFLRGRPELTKLMQRLVNPGKRLPDKAGEPDFYEISRKYPLPAAPAGAAIEPPIASPHGRPGQPGAGYPFPPQAGGFYPYGYPAGPYPQMASPTSYGQPPGFPPQPPQQAYWPNQMAPGMYPPPNPAGYGYPYPYAPQMMMPPQGYDPQSFQQPGMYGQYPGYPGTPKGGAFNPTSPSVKKPPAEGVQPQLEGQGPGPGQYPYQPAAGAEQPSGEASEAREVDDRKPAALSGQKRSLDERPSAPTRELEGSTPPNAAGSAQGGTYNQSQYEMQQPGAGVQQPGASEGQSGGAGAEGGDAAAKQTTEGSGGAVKQEDWNLF